MNQSLSEILLHALIDGGIEKLVQASSEYLNYPVMVVHMRILHQKQQLS